MIEVPGWVTDGFRFAQAMAVARWQMPKTTAAERAANSAFTASPGFPCSACGKFAFSKADAICFWCRNGR